MFYLCPNRYSRSYVRLPVLANDISYPTLYSFCVLYFHEQMNLQYYCQFLFQLVLFMPDTLQNIFYYNWLGRTKYAASKSTANCIFLQRIVISRLDMYVKKNMSHFASFIVFSVGSDCCVPISLSETSIGGSTARP